jgi:F-type H+-transporting ATPase subunit b
VRRLAIWFALLVFLSFTALAEEHAPKGEAHGEEGGQNVILWKWANFAILAAGLGFLIVKQAGPYFATRSIEIQKGIADAQKIRADAEASAAAMNAKLANLSLEVEAMRKSAKEEAAQEGVRIRQETERELAKIQAHSEQEISSALKAAQIELKKYSAQLAVNLARQKVRERMTPADEDALVQNFVADLSGKLDQQATP